MGLTLVTGATGTIGNAIVDQLLANGRDVRCLVRDPEKARAIIPAGADLTVGDVTDATSVARAMSDCSAVFHAAGMTEQWVRDTTIFDRLNAGGTKNMVDAALAEGVESFVYTSTQDMFDLSANPFDETMLSLKPLKSHYERSKQKAERTVEKAFDAGLPVRFIHPVATYGPAKGAPTGLNVLIQGLARGAVPVILPGGLPVVLNEDVARGQLLAEEKGAPGERYILSESYQTLEEIACAVAEIVPNAKVPNLLPGWTAALIAEAGELMASVIGKRPLISRGELSVLRRKGRPSSEKAKRDLGWQPRTFEVGLAMTVEAIVADCPSSGFLE